MSSPTEPPAFSHAGICVSDLDASIGFYTGVFGFELAERHEVGPEFAALMELEGVRVRSQFLRRGPLTIELLSYEAPSTIGEAVRRPMNQLGLTHLSFKVDDLELAAERVRAHGGTVHDATRTTFGPELDFVYCTDPDGVRIELMRLPV